uniref:Uncharacterized protein n=1 Tax=Globisporangium ultimum (strain ATCC 200006 / CBS 805.95 / DAOM BR144) TaxID=431595 RepID=K3WI07_GLOUD
MDAGGAHIPVSGGDDMDPSLAGGFRVIYDRETPFELRIQVRFARNKPVSLAGHIVVLLYYAMNDPLAGQLAR